MLQVAGDVFQHHNGVVDHEAGGNRQRHQRQIVQGVSRRYITPNVPISDRGTADAGNDGGAHRAQKNEHHQDHEND